MITRRGLLSSVLALSAAPAIVRADSLMPIRVPSVLLPTTMGEGDFTMEAWLKQGPTRTFISDIRWSRGVSRYAAHGTAVRGIVRPDYRPESIAAEFVLPDAEWHRCIIERGPNGLCKSMQAS